MSGQLTFVSLALPTSCFPTADCLLPTAYCFWCERGDSNPHTFRYQILSLARLPIPPLSQLNQTESENSTHFGACASDAPRVSFEHQTDHLAGRVLIWFRVVYLLKIRSPSCQPGDEVSTGSDSDRVSTLHTTRHCEHETRSLPLGTDLIIPVGGGAKTGAAQPDRWERWLPE